MKKGKHTQRVSGKKFEIPAEPPIPAVAPVPNEFGVYSDQTPGVVNLIGDGKKGWYARISVLRLGEFRWAVGYGYVVKGLGVGCGGSFAGMTERASAGAKTRQEVLGEALFKMLSVREDWTMSKTTREQWRGLREWAEAVTSKLKQGVTKMSENETTTTRPAASGKKAKSGKGAASSGFVWASRKLAMIPIGELVLSAENPRGLPNRESLEELAASIRTAGILVPLIARPHPALAGKFELRAGTRRLAAAAMAGLAEVPVVVTDLDERGAMQATLLENMQREDLTAAQEAAGVEALARYATVEEIAAHLGRSVAWVRKRLSLRGLSKAWKLIMDDPSKRPMYTSWDTPFYERVARFPPELQDRILEALTQYEREQWNWIENLEHLDRFLSGWLHWLPGAPWDRDDKSGGACSSCAKRSSCQADLFDSVPDNKPAGDDRCLDAECWRTKMAGCLREKRREIQEKTGKDCRFVWPGTSNAKDLSADLVKGGASDWTIKGCQKGDKGAWPYLRVDGGKAGTWYWAKPRYSSEDGGQGSDGGKAGPKSPDEKRKALEKRRDVRAIGDVVKGLAQPDSDTIVRLTAVFGTAERRDSQYGEGNEWGAFDQLCANETRESYERLWQQVSRVLAMRLRTQYSVPVDEAKSVCARLGLDWGALRAAAAEAIPEPKSWAKEAAAGKDKGAGKKAGKGKATKPRRRERGERAGSAGSLEPSALLGQPRDDGKDETARDKTLEEWLYNAPHGQVVLRVGGGINGTAWATYWTKPTGSKKRLVSPHLPVRASEAEAVADLRAFADSRGLEKADG